MRVCTVFLIDIDDVYTQLLDAMVEAEKICLGDVKWKLRYQRPNPFFAKKGRGGPSRSPPPPPSRWMTTR